MSEPRPLLPDYIMVSKKRDTDARWGFHFGADYLGFNRQTGNYTVDTPTSDRPHVFPTLHAALTFIFKDEHAAADTVHFWADGDDEDDWTEPGGRERESRLTRTLPGVSKRTQS